MANVGGEAMDAPEFMWNMYNEHVTHGRQHEDQREKMTAGIAVFAAAVLALYSSEKSLINASVAGCLLFALGTYGTLFSLKHYERFRRHGTFAAIYRNQLETLLTGIPLKGKEIKVLGDEQHEKTPLFRALTPVRLHWLWAGMPAMISAGGLLLLIAAQAGLLR
jgi:hypothetical protein